MLLLRSHALHVARYASRKWQKLPSGELTQTQNLQSGEYTNTKLAYYDVLLQTLKENVKNVYLTLVHYVLMVLSIVLGHASLMCLWLTVNGNSLIAWMTDTQVAKFDVWLSVCLSVSFPVSVSVCLCLCLCVCVCVCVCVRAYVRACQIASNIMQSTCITQKNSQILLIAGVCTMH